jgi:trimethylamine--corrinoid protein Co-methyltransferase
MPEDPDAVSGIREIAEKGGAKNANHTLKHVDAFARWHKVLAEAGEKQSYYPELKDFSPSRGEKVVRGPAEESVTQLQETFLQS